MKRESILGVRLSRKDAVTYATDFQSHRPRQTRPL